MLQNALFVIIGLAVLTLIGWLARGFFTSAEVPLFVRVIIGVVAVAGVALLGIVIRDRIAQAKKEDFKEVDK
jgi:hypothetical protein